MRNCKGCEAKDAHIASLQEQIEWLRLHNGTPMWARKTDAEPGPLDVIGVPAWEQPAWLSEDEEEIEAMKQAGLIDPSDAAAALAQVGAMSTDIQIEG